MKRERPEVWDAFWHRLAQCVQPLGIKFLAGDFNMSFIEVPKQPRSRGIVCDCRHWYSARQFVEAAVAEMNNVINHAKSLGWATEEIPMDDKQMITEHLKLQEGMNRTNEYEEQMKKVAMGIGRPPGLELMTERPYPVPDHLLCG